MPVKKATRSTRATRTTKASSNSASSDFVLNENADGSVGLVDAKKKSAKSAASNKKVLGERNAPNSHKLSLPNEASSQTAERKAAKIKSSKPERGNNTALDDVKQGRHSSDSRATTPVPSSPLKKRLPEEQVQAFLQNYDLEAQARLSRLRTSLEISVQSSLTRMRLAIERIPRAVRELTLAEFIDDYGADIHTFMGRAPVQHLEETQKEWDEIKERSPIKPKRSKKDEEAASKADRNTKSARTINSTASACTSRTAPPTAGGKKKVTRSAKASSSRSTSAAPTSPPPTSSSKPAPSLSTFQPDLPKEALQTPRPRMARPGEVIQWRSINGSPICGIISEDGVVRPVTFA
ncbi:uncharacterized protein MEPE_00415 [Melanopsichium pennsylvanicum]|uniref:Borealin N-terminal domain-containing protein n=2 Tax=Melanopsichium pennsylvanicum TaxID=63383 RepID=A0AAJ4XFV7_9BASI|nr:conserved hypothetical protein [Melanopsichium pennsylvanicum 4]SNX81710.1 uncharacterized protein MEPE_00415 [Melanopsichium pennsylvanicum]